MWLACLFSIDQDVIQIHYDKDVKLFSEDFINVALKTGWSIGESKRHDLVLEVAVPSTKNSLSFVAFSNSHPIVDTSQIQLGKLLGPT